MRPPVESVAVQDFQSIKDADVELGRFTVLVGPSNSGKSAFLRATRACLRNSFVPANVRSGSTKSVVTVNLADAEPVSMERGKSLSTYILGSEKYTKANRAVPEPVAKAISMPLVEGEDLNFSFQFDRPFLLAETGSRAAQVVGSLTNITLLHEAIREANRRRQEATQRLKIRQSDVEQFLSQADDFADLPQEQQLLTSATAELNRLYEWNSRLARLRELTQDARQYEAEFDALWLKAAGTQPPKVDFEQAGKQLARLQSLRSLVDQARKSHWEIRQQVSHAQSLGDQVTRHRQAYQDALHEMGVCPTCGRAVE